MQAARPRLDELSHHLREPLARCPDLAQERLVLGGRREAEAVGERRRPGSARQRSRPPGRWPRPPARSCSDRSRGRPCRSPPRRSRRAAGERARRRSGACRTQRLAPGALRASPPGRSTARARAARARRRTTTSSAVPTNATSSLAWTPAGSRPTARTRGLSAGLSSRRSCGAGCCLLRRRVSRRQRSDLQLGRASDEVRDQPAVRRSSRRPDRRP